MRMPKPFYRRQTGSWYVQMGKRQISLGPDKDKATEKYHTLMIGKQGAGTDLTVATLVKLFLVWNQRHRDAGTQVFYSRPLLSFVEHVGVKLRVADVKKRIVEDWIDHKFVKGSNPNYKRNWLRAVVRLFNWAVDKEHITHSPVQRLQKPAAKPREAIITAEQWEQLVAVLKTRKNGQSVLDLITLMRLTGCRPLEARTVEARHLDRKSRCLVFERELSKGETDEKTVDRRVVPLTDEAFALCSRLALKHPAEPLFLRWNGKPWTNKDLKNYFGRLTRPMPRKDRKTGKKYFSTPALDFHMTPYTIRHTWATDALVRGVDMATVATIMGHKDTTQLMKTYQHLKLKSDHLRAMLHVAVGEQPAPSLAPVALPA